MDNDTMELTVAIAASDAHVLQVAVKGSVSWDSHTRLGEQLDMAAGFGWRGKSLLLDLSGVSFIDSSGISSLLTFHREIQNQGVNLVLFHVPARVEQLFRLVGLCRIVPMANTAAEARDRLNASISSGPNIFTTDDQKVTFNRDSITGHSGRNHD